MVRLVDYLFLKYTNNLNYESISVRHINMYQSLKKEEEEVYIEIGVEFRFRFGGWKWNEVNGSDIYMSSELELGLR